MSIKNTIGHMIKCSLDKINVSEPIEEKNIVVEIPAKKENGDYSTNIALILTKKLHKSPMDIANEVINNLPDNNIIDLY